jgi:MarR family transcriptional regulator, transcriptional regulator for hemolysin
MTKRKDLIGTQFQDVARLRIFCYNALLKDSEITATQSRVMIALFEEEGIIQGDIARIIGIRAVTVGGIVDRMEAKGWIERRPDAKDRRANRIWVTPKGRDLEGVINSCREQVNDLSLKGVKAKDLGVVLDAMEIIRSNLKGFQDNQENN